MTAGQIAGGMRRLEDASRLSSSFVLDRKGILMQPDRDDPMETEGTLNPAATRGPDGELYLFPRIVAAGNYSRIGIARVLFDSQGEPVAVERLGIALEPSEPYEKNPLTGGGCEDARITYVKPLRQYVMTYTAFSPLGPRIALATSDNLREWRRLGLVHFTRYGTQDLDSLDNKDGLLFPTFIVNPRSGQPALGLIHRPFFFESSAVLAQALQPEAPGPASRWGNPKPRVQHPSMWISYCDTPRPGGNITTFGSHHRLMSPRAWWERHKIGGGAPPLETPYGWLVLYHGVMGHENANRHLRYSAGVIVLDLEQPEHIRYRTPRPILRPDFPEDHFDWLDVVFPTGIDQRTDLGQPDRIDVYFGMADQRIGVATLHLPTMMEVALPTQQRKVSIRRLSSMALAEGA